MATKQAEKQAERSFDKLTILTSAPPVEFATGGRGATSELRQKLRQMEEDNWLFVDQVDPKEKAKLANNVSSATGALKNEGGKFSVRTTTDGQVWVHCVTPVNGGSDTED